MVRYAASLLFIALWWWIAIHEEKSRFPKAALLLPKSKLETPHLSTLTRDELKRALEGDIDTMISLANSWNVDAAILEKMGKKAKNLSSDELLKMQLLRRVVSHEPNRDIAFFPQTFLSAALLLTIAPGVEITSLPDGFRRQREIYSDSFTCSVPLDTDPGKNETFLSLKPTVAFLAPYSHPAVRSNLEERGVHLVEGKTVSSFDDLYDAIRITGSLTGEEERAEILSLFVKAALFHFQNRIPQSEKELLYLKASSTLAAPRRDTLLGNFLGDCNSFSLTTKTLEEVITKKPKKIFLSSSDHERALMELSSQSGFHALLKEGTTFCFVDWHTQETLSHFFLLACFDIVSLLTEDS